MNVYIFGNQDIKEDDKAIVIAINLKGKIKNVDFIFVKPNEDLPFTNKENVLIMDTVQEIEEIKIIENKDLDKIILPPRGTAHDFDLGFQLKYLKKLGKLGEVKIIGLPQKGTINYKTVQSILRKLVAQDIQGS